MYNQPSRDTTTIGLNQVLLAVATFVAAFVIPVQAYELSKLATAEPEISPYTAEAINAQAQQGSVAGISTAASASEVISANPNIQGLVAIGGLLVVVGLILLAYLALTRSAESL